MSQLSNFLKRRLKSFKYAFNGIFFVFRTQTNFKIHTVAAITAIAFSVYFKINTTEWLFVISAIFSVFFAETVNTIIEEIMNYVSPEFNKKVGIIKDMAAGAVLLTAFYSVFVGIIIFMPKIISLFWH